MRMLALSLACASAACAPVERPGAAPAAVEVWLTTPDKAALLAPQAPLAFEPGAPADAIMVDPAKRYQRMVGFGASITDASAWLIQKRMTAAQREKLLAELFGPAPGLNFAFTRLTVGASDFSLSHYSYDDVAKGQTDPGLAHFSIAPARAEVLPTAKAARAVNPQLAVMISPWSAPGWMKTSDSLIKGSLREAAYAPFATYLRRTVQDFAAAIGPIDYLSIQNEPDFEPENYPGMRLSAAQRARIIGDHLGPEFARAGLKTRILDWDHNWDQPAQPLGVLADPAAARHVAGVAWHCYNGDVAAQSEVRDRHPDKGVFFTECSGGEWSKAWPDSWAWTIRTLIIGSTRNWARGVLMWNLALDENFGPHLGGCGNCRGVVAIDSKTGEVTRNPEYYAFGHASRFVAVGAQRIASESRPGGIETVAFANPDGSRVLLAFNAGKEMAAFPVAESGRYFAYRLAPNAAATFRWRDPR
ncbi:glycoside hydrolase family 30 beta sandwich domain-containing protein [Sphingomonas sp. DG1-23]|uniref:glycoside hydrolase family 30 protein n=1 Tax=Sphingomonas sp. DG1-23 TaxID=3068316 RepID=UPI00273D1DAA|nr:glycoside hydrolase family 30 beta sandwich domain-containing protein [Sphingomonas sp. DG1-23]MDP5279020.1 glycoside hydrolase family 30 beta sandwich domain-containing protein [Sphingomonas sp. DG1-23]